MKSSPYLRNSWKLMAGRRGMSVFFSGEGPERLAILQ